MKWERKNTKQKTNILAFLDILLLLSSLNKNPPISVPDRGWHPPPPPVADMLYYWRLPLVVRQLKKTARTPSSGGGRDKTVGVETGVEVSSWELSKPPDISWTLRLDGGTKTTFSLNKRFTSSTHPGQTLDIQNISKIKYQMSENLVLKKWILCAIQFQDGGFLCN